MVQKRTFTFKAVIDIIGINPFVYVPDVILEKIFLQAGKDKGHIPICGKINTNPYHQTLVKYAGAWRLYINMTMLKDSPKRIGETITVTITFDPEPREVSPPIQFLKALDENSAAKTVFEKLSPSRKSEIIRYLANLKTEESLSRNITRMILHLTGKASFAGRTLPQ